MIEIIPFGDRALVEMLPKESVIGTLILPDTVGQRSWLAKVVACGDKVTRFKVDDIVVLSFYTGVIINLYENRWTNTAHRLITEEEALGMAHRVEDGTKS